MKHVVCNGSRLRKLKMYLTLVLVMITVINDVKTTKASSNRDYLNISLADIIVTWYNASGVAIGNSQLLNEIEALYGLITIEDLVDNEVIVTTDITATKEDIKQAIGYGSASVPYLRIDHRKLKQYLGGLPTDEVARKALTAMFSWENNATEESIFEALGIVVGNVVNLGKIGYNVIKDTLVENINSLPLVQTLKDVYNNFTNSTYFQDILNGGDEQTGGHEYLSPYTLLSESRVPEGYRVGIIKGANDALVYVAYVPENMVLISAKIGIYMRQGLLINISDVTKTGYIGNNGTITNQVINNPTTTQLTMYELQTGTTSTLTGRGNISSDVLGMALYVPDTITTLQEVIAYVQENNPWTTGGIGGTGNGISEYINKAVGNITKQNYINLAPNIGNGEYMFIFNKYQYDVVINQITDNSNNGNYSQNGDIITTYNTTYIQNPISVDTRPTYVPAPTGQPIQPFISPRPTPVPEETEEAIYNGGIAETIKDKFPFCIPWDIQALINGLWTNNRQAPYIHWEARFGSWGKLGEVTIDLQPYDTVAQIFRSTTLLLWIIGLVIITRNIIGS